MKPDKNIDRLFQTKLKDIEVTPPEIVWENIELHLKGKKIKRVLPIWFRFAGVAAILLLLTFVGIKYTQNISVKNSIENTITDTDKTDNPKIDNNPIEQSITLENEDVNTDIISNATSKNDKDNKNNPTEIVNSLTNIKTPDSQKNKSTNKNILATKNNTEKTIETKDYTNPSNKIDNSITQRNTKEPENENLISGDLDSKTKNKQTTLKEKDALASNNTPIVSKDKKVVDEKEITYQNIENLEDTLEDKTIADFKNIPKDLNKRWIIASVFAPVYYNSFNSKGSPLDTQFENSPKEGSQTISYGVKVGYQLSKKLSLQSGVTLLNVGYRIDDIYINPNTQSSSKLKNVNYTNTNEILILNVFSDQLNQSSLESSGNSNSEIRGNLNQEYGYVEVPMELKYRLSNGKFGIHVVAGFSTLFLNSNNVYVKTDAFLSNLGEAKNLNKINFSGNIGLDLDYKINNSFFINVAPMLKIHTSTFSEDSKNFEPYIIGIYTGLNYRF